MPAAEARIPTTRSSRYLRQLFKHLENRGRHLGHRPRFHGGGEQARHPASEARIEWSDTHGVADFGWSRATVDAYPDALAVRVEAEDAANLENVQELITGHLKRFGRRDGLQVLWLRSDSQAA